MVFKRGDPRVCSMARAPTPQEEDRRRVCRERRILVGERVRHVNRIRGLLFAQGVFGYEPLRKHRRERLEELRTGDGRPLPVHLKAQIIRELDRLEVVLAQLKTVAAERDALLKPASDKIPSRPAMLVQLKGIDAETAAVLWSEGLFRRFDNRRQVAAYAALLHGSGRWLCGLSRSSRTTSHLSPDASMPFKLNQDRRQHIPRQKRKVTNWREYDAGLRQRGSLTVWFTDEAVQAWQAEPRATRGGQPDYSPLAILTALTLRAVFRLPFRQTEGLIGSVIGLLGLNLAVCPTIPPYAAGPRRWRCRGHDHAATANPCTCWWTARA